MEWIEWTDLNLEIQAAHDLVVVSKLLRDTARTIGHLNFYGSLETSRGCYGLAQAALALRAKLKEEIDDTRTRHAICEDIDLDEEHDANTPSMVAAEKRRMANEQ